MDGGARHNRPWCGKISKKPAQAGVHNNKEIKKRDSTAAWWCFERQACACRPFTISF
jgi:hypothetical protein